jgi:hypothetical protein
MTGKAGRYSIGVLDIRTGDEPDVGAKATNFGAVRLKRDILRGATSGNWTYRSRSVRSPAR